MSLLMDALKKAEAAKQQATENLASAPLDLSVDGPMAPPLQLEHPAEPALPDLATHSATVDADLAAESTAPPPRRAAPSAKTPRGNPNDTSDRLAARNVFEAKQPPATRAHLWIFAGLAGLAALSIGGYFWWQLQSVSVAPMRPAPAATPVSRPIPTPSQAAITPPAPPTIPTVAAAAPPATPPAAQPAAPAVTATPIMADSQPEIAFTRTDKRSAAPAQDRAPKPAARPATTAKDPGLQFSKTSGATPLERAYEALQADRLDEAQAQYARALRGDRHNVDALLGLATVAVRQGKIDEGLTWYQRVLEADPGDPTAQAALINLKGQGDLSLAESRLRTALASQPESAALHFALGNLYARQQRWSEAQQAYFTAFSREGNNADYIFNLAVSLDHLHQHKLAAQYYQMAVNAAQTDRSVSFDTARARNRALELQP